MVDRSSFEDQIEVARIKYITVVFFCYTCVHDCNHFILIRIVHSDSVVETSWIKLLEFFE